MNVTEMGRAGLTGMPGKVGAAAAQPISERTSLTREQVEALIGAILLLYAIYRFARMLSGVWRAGQGDLEADYR